jgi:hypothetical protein
MQLVRPGRRPADEDGIRQVGWRDRSGGRAKLRYRDRLEELGYPHVLALLVPEREPRDRSWRELCNKVGVIMLSRGELDRAPRLGREAV